MSRLILAIDQTPCRASYGLLTPAEFGRQLAATRRQVVRENIARTVSRGNQLAEINGASIPDLAGEEYLATQPPDIALVSVERPNIHVARITGGLINMFI